MFCVCVCVCVFSMSVEFNCNLYLYLFLIKTSNFLTIYPPTLSTHLRHPSSRPLALAAAPPKALSQRSGSRAEQCTQPSAPSPSPDLHHHIVIISSITVIIYSDLPTTLSVKLVHACGKPCLPCCLPACLSIYSFVICLR